MFATIKYTPFTTLSKARGYFCNGEFGYSFHFNGMENDSETYGEGNALDFGARIYDTRLGRWMSVDPISGDYAEWSPFTFSMNSPIGLVDPDGKRVYFAAGAGDDSRGWNYTTRFHAIMNAKGVDFRPLHASHGGLGDMQFVLMNSQNSSRGSQIVSNNGKLEVKPIRVTDKMIAKVVADIKADLAKNPLKEGEGLNLAGYSYGSVLMAHVALKLSDDGIKVNNLVLIGSQISSKSELYQSLQKITNVVREDIPGDKLSNPQSSQDLMDGLKQNSDPNDVGIGPHFDYARPDNPDTKNVNEAKQANKNISKLADRMLKKGIK